MKNRTCTLAGCTAEHDARGLCRHHYKAARRAGTLVVLPRLTIVERLAANSEIRDACLVWTGDVNAKGYGRIVIGGVHHLVHRVAWIERHGPIPDETPNVLHRCDNPPCFADEHLWLGTQADNLADMAAKHRGRSPIRVAGETCARGHALTVANSYRYGGRVQCRRCRADWMREKRARAGRSDR